MMLANAYTISDFNPKFFWNRPPESKYFLFLFLFLKHFRFLLCKHGNG